MKPTILLVEDDQDLGKAIQQSLITHGYEVQLCYTYAQALQEIQTPYSCYLLDIQLQDGNGLRLCRRIREHSDAPILIISADQAEGTILQGYAYQADDYITKPFRLSILLAKIKAVLHRTQPPTLFEYQGYRLSCASLCLFLPDDESIPLTVTETAILHVLFANPSRYVTRAELQRAIWMKTGRETSDETITVRISMLNKKIPAASVNFIESIRYLGYRLRIQQ